MPGGAKKGNTSAMTHGIQGSVLPPGCSHITAQLDRFRRATQEAAIAARGELGLIELCAIQTSTSWYRHALLARRWLRIADAQMTLDQKIFFSREEARALAERDKALRQLGLDQRDNGAPTTLYTLPIDPEPTTDAANAPADAPG